MTPVILLAPHAAQWGAFDCGDPRITNKLAREALRSGTGLQRLYGIVGDRGEVLAAMTLRAGELAAPAGVRYELGQGEPEVPTLHMEVLAVRREQQGRGLGQTLVLFALELARRLQAQIGIRTFSLEATDESRDFYERLGFDVADDPWPGRTWPCWIVLD